jgi:sugar (pentulose or hexulose) kinase
LGCPISRPVITEAGALGAAILGGIGKGIFSSVKTGVEAMVSVECTFDPNPNLIDQYTLRYEQYRQIWPLMKHFLLAH